MSFLIVFLHNFQVMEYRFSPFRTIPDLWGERTTVGSDSWVPLDFYLFMFWLICKTLRHFSDLITSYYQFQKVGKGAGISILY